ncbi:MAG: acyltransferase family protein [Gemmiger sp.]|uniref:acyltransferase family protein n=1 Tax=Gemmiger sp. TaxID=2049027 RepID=UPI002A90B202|nr:acyltransferase family protein [Gemmiger sp.]MDY5203833.1 acyltransferase family protein [Gemmiger sp.]MDY5501223.1 acyltransferase family protein [Gemmiger sp.]
MRAVALASILIVHFNATVTGYFTLPHKLFTSTLVQGIYLGDFGSSLFFIVSGASLALTTPPEQSPWQFYKKRAKAVYPLFWLAWAVCFSIRFISQPGYYAGAKTVTLVLTFLGLDNFAVAAGWVGMDFACVGEWFLGSILFLYLLFPLLQRALRRSPLLTWAVTLAVCIPIHMHGWDAGLVAVHIPEFLFGMTFLTLKDQMKVVLMPLLVSGLINLPVDEKLLCAMFSAFVFIALAAVAAPLMDKPLPRAVCAKAAKLSYAVFLVHHVLIQRLVRGFDLAALSRRDTAILFCVYLLATYAAAEALLWLQRWLREQKQVIFQ